MDCGIPFCNNGCPLGNIIPDFNDLVFRDKWEDALVAPALDEQLPGVHRARLSGAVRAGLRARHQPGSGRDQAGRVGDRPPRLRRGLGAAAAARAPHRSLGRRGRLRARRASPPRSSSTRAGHTVTLFEKSDRIGGLLRYGIPDFKLEKWLIDRRLEQMRAEGVIFQTGVHVGVDLSVGDAAPQLRRGAALHRRRAAARSRGPGPRARRRPLRDGLPDPAEPARRRRRGRRRATRSSRPASTS